MNRYLFGSLVVILGLSVLAVIFWGDLSRPGNIKVLIIDGQNNHDWKATTPVLKRALLEAGRFDVDVATSPPHKADMSSFKPNFSAYDVVLSNYNGDPWPEETKKAFVEYVKQGGGFVCVHAANNAFGNWREYNEIIGLGGWGGRSEKSGPYIYYTEKGELTRDEAPGPGGGHGPQHDFLIAIRDQEHPITRDMPLSWMHAKDELYDKLRGPALNMRVLATAYAPKTKAGRDLHEPMMMTIQYGKGRVFHTPMGHADYSMKCVGFVTALRRGCEWAARGEVTIPIPENFPTPTETSSYDY
ncbi:MAG: ThuA domain-containing protein [Planctomycetota bacterium]|nr:MAG: ThuA domain-containing protein [Planctomycetota bacterium]REK47622.1 MAG: ThuA domain-containing protein [Planctomycetota bacterium]